MKLINKINRYQINLLIKNINIIEFQLNFYN